MKGNNPSVAWSAAGGFVSRGAGSSPRTTQCKGVAPVRRLNYELTMDEARLAYWANYVGTQSREQLAYDARFPMEHAVPELAEAIARRLEQLGGPPSATLMKEWLDAKLARRDKGRSATEPGDPSIYLRQAACPNCASETTQTQHGYTVTGGLWKGHVCTCKGWECRGCGSVLQRSQPCCR